MSLATPVPGEEWIGPEMDETTAAVAAANAAADEETAHSPEEQAHEEAQDGLIAQNSAGILSTENDYGVSAIDQNTGAIITDYFTRWYIPSDASPATAAYVAEDPTDPDDFPAAHLIDGTVVPINRPDLFEFESTLGAQAKSDAVESAAVASATAVATDLADAAEASAISQVHTALDPLVAKSLIQKLATTGFASSTSSLGKAVTVANTTTETTLLSYPIGGSNWHVGDVLRIIAPTEIQQSTGSAVNLTIKVKIGATVIMQLTNGSVGNNAVRRRGRILLDVALTNTAAQASWFDLTLQANAGGSDTIGNTGGVGFVGENNTAVDVSATPDVLITAQWASANSLAEITVKSAWATRLPYAT